MPKIRLEEVRDHEFSIGRGIRDEFKLVLICNRKNHEMLRGLKPLSRGLGVRTSVLEGCVGNLGHLEADREVPACDDVELIALDVTAHVVSC